MALTMSRTRTQTALNKLVELVANINGELEFLEGLLTQEHPEEVRERLRARQVKLKVDRGALLVTIRQFDPILKPEEIGLSDGWERAYSYRRLTRPNLLIRYLAGRHQSMTSNVSR